MIGFVEDMKVIVYNFEGVLQLFETGVQLENSGKYFMNTFNQSRHTSRYSEVRKCQIPNSRKNGGDVLA